MNDLMARDKNNKSFVTIISFYISTELSFCWQYGGEQRSPAYRFRSRIFFFRTEAIH